MGASNSKIQVSETNTSDVEVVNEKSAPFQDTELSNAFGSLSVEESPIDVDGTIASSKLSIWKKSLLESDKNILAQNAFAKNAITNIISVQSDSVRKTNKHFFNLEVKDIGSPSFYNNQKLSGRCWIFATANVLRSHILKNFNLKDDEFQLSQSYIFFYDKLEKANFFLENILDTTDMDLDSRLVQHLLLDPVGDGGQWDMIVNVVSKYGLVPHDLFPDNFQSSNSSRLNYVLTDKLREYALILRKLKSSGASSSEIQNAKRSMVQQAFNIISLALGSPPHPEDTFEWEFKDKNGTFRRIGTTPLGFYEDYVKYDVSKHFSLIHDPRNSYYQLYTVDRLNNVHGGKPIEYVNTEISVLKSTVIGMIKKNEPVFFGSDVGKFGDSSSGMLDVAAFDYGIAFGTSFNISKAERLKTGSSQMTHAMVITGVHLDEAGNPVRWKIENSWGPDVGDRGYFMMTDKWFDEYVFQIVTSKEFVDKKIYSIWKSKDYSVLPFYDPMGALA